MLRVHKSTQCTLVTTTWIHTSTHYVLLVMGMLCKSMQYPLVTANKCKEAKSTLLTTGRIHQRMPYALVITRTLEGARATFVTMGRTCKGSQLALMMPGGICWGLSAPATLQ